MNTESKFSGGQITVLALAAVPMAAAGVAGAYASFTNFAEMLSGRFASALGLVAAGEGTVLICSLIALSVTLMGQHTPTVVRLGMWIVPVASSGVGIALAPSNEMAVSSAFTPLAMTAAGEGIAFVARRVVAYGSGIDLEAQRRSGLLLWHANRAAKGWGPGRWLSLAAVGRLTKSFAATDAQLVVQLGEVQRTRITENADVNLALVLSGSGKGRNRASAARWDVKHPPLTVKPRKAVEASPEQGEIAPSVVDQAKQMRNEAVRRLATSFDVPEEIVKGLSVEWASSETAPAESPMPEWVRTEINRRAETQEDGFDMAAATHEAMAAEMAEIEHAVTGGLWTGDDVAEFLNCKPSYVRTLTKREHFGVAGQIGQRNLYDPAEVRAYAARRDA